MTKQNLELQQQLSEVDEHNEDRNRELQEQLAAQHEEHLAAMDKLKELNEEIASKCVNAGEVSAMMDSKIEEVKRFVGEFAKKLPTPVEIEVKTKWLGAKKRIVLRFRCARDSEVTLEIESAQWSTWLKFGVSLMKAGTCALTGDVLGVQAKGIEAACAAYEALKPAKDERGGFDALLRQPFLLSSEQDELISGLRGEGFFEKFAYDEQRAEWCATDAYVASQRGS